MKRRHHYFFYCLLFLVICSLLSQSALSETVKIPESLTVIEDEAFYGNNSLDQVELPEGILSIGSRAFAHSSLQEINLPDSLSFIANDAFSESEHVHVTASAGTYAYDWAAANGYILSAPNQSKAKGGDKKITVTWNQVEHADSYSVFYGTSSDITSATEIPGITETSYTIQNLARGTTYYSWVKAKKGDETSNASNMQSVITGPNTPTPNTPIVSGNSISLSWNEVKGATYYQISYSKTNDYSTATKAGNIKSTSYVLTGLEYSTTYYIWYAAGNASTTLRKTNAVSVTTGADPDDAIAVTSITINNTDNYQFAYGQSRQMTATVAPTNATNKTIRWVKMSGTDGIDIDPKTGLVTAAKSGRIHICAEALDGSDVVSNDFWLYCIPSEVPTLTIDRIGAMRIRVSWNEVPGALFYRIYYKAASQTEWQVERIEGAGIHSHELIGLLHKDINPSKDKNIEIKIQAFSFDNKKSGSGESTPLTAKLLSEAEMENPTVSIKSKTSNSITLNLKAGNNNTSWYTINYCANKVDGEWTIDKEIDDIPGDTTTFTINGLQSNTKYYIDVIPETWDYGDFSTVFKSITATTSAGTGAPSAPTNITATALSDSSIKLSWTAPSDAAGYYIYRTSVTSTPTKVTGRNNTEYTVTGLNPNTEYSFYVSSYNSSNIESEREKIKGTTTNISLGKTTGVKQTSNTTSSISLSWTSLSNAAKYDVFWRATTAGSGAWNSAETGSTTYTITGLAAGNTYEVCVVGKNSTARGTQSDSVIMSTKESTTVTVTGVSLNKTIITLYPGGSSEVLTETVNPSNATNKSVTWTSSDTSVATVSNGIVTPKSTGTATITVKTADGGYTAKSTVNVINEIISVTGVSLNKTNATLITGGGTETLTATISPSDATYKNITWTSSDTSVVTVSNGVLTPVGAGTATITVNTSDGNKTATCKVTVKSNLAISTHPMDQVAAEGSTVTMKVAAAGGLSSYSYQWYCASDTTETGTKVSTNQNYSFTASLNDSEKYYYCVVTSGSNSVTSNRAYLIISENPTPYGEFEDRSITLTQGETRTFTVAGGVSNSNNFVYTVNGARPDGSELGIASWAGNTVTDESTFSRLFTIDATESGEFHTAGTYILNLWVRDINSATAVKADTITVNVTEYIDPSVTLSGNFTYSEKTIMLGETWIAEAEVSISGGTGNLGVITINSSDLSGSTLTDNFTDHHTSKVQTKDWGAYRIDTSKSPWNTPGTYILKLWAKDTNGVGGNAPISTMKLIIQKASEPVVIHPSADLASKFDSLKNILKDKYYWSWGGTMQTISSGGYSISTSVCSSSKCVNHSDVSVCSSCQQFGFVNGKPEARQRTSRSSFHSTQCAGFAWMVGWAISGKNPYNDKYKIKANDLNRAELVNNLEPGDIIRIGADRHSAVVINTDENNIYVVHCNFDNYCGISWNYAFSRKALSSNGGTAKGQAGRNRLFHVYKYSKYK